MLPLADICKKKHNVYYHLYANDTQLYLPIKMGDNSAVQSLFDFFIQFLVHFFKPNQLTKIKS